MDPQQVALVKKLLTVNPSFRLGNLSGGIDDILKDPFFSSINWTALENKQVTAPYTPPIKDQLDSSNFDHYDEADEIPIYEDSQEPFENF